MKPDRRQQSRLLMLVPVLVVLNLSFGAPFLCQLHCTASAGEMTISQDLPHNGQATESRGLVDDHPMRFNCSGGQSGSTHMTVSATYEFANLFGGLSVQPQSLFAPLPISKATFAATYLPPPEKPPALPF